MKRRLRRYSFTISLIAALANSSPYLVFASTNERVADAKPSDVESQYSVCVGTNARWIVDRRHGVVYAVSLETDRPLWSRDGVVFRLTTKRPTLDFSNLNNVSAATRRNGEEIAGRVYLLLDDITSSKKDLQRDALLIALDPRAQGRVVWELRAKEFAFAFPGDESQPAFTRRIEALGGDELIIQIQTANACRNFAVDAATGSPRPLAQ